MPDLALPTIAVYDSFRGAMAEFAAEGRGHPEDDSTLGRQLREVAWMWGSPTGFEQYVNALLQQRLDEAPRPPGHVPSTTLWWVDDCEYLGRLAIRHRL